MRGIADLQAGRSATQGNRKEGKMSSPVTGHPEVVITNGRTYQQNLIREASKKALEILGGMHSGETTPIEEFAEKISPNWRIAIKAFDNLADLGYLTITDNNDKVSCGIIRKAY